MADANIRINVETASLEQLNSELASLQAQISKLPVGSAEFKRLSAEIRRVDGAVESANRKLKSLDVGAIAGDVAKLGGAVASASALFKQFGAEGSDSQEAVQKALETTNTILGAGAIAEGVASAARLAGVAATKAASAAQAAYTAVVGTSTGALKAFKIALASTGIGLVVVAIGALASNWDKLAAAIGGSSKSAKEFKTENEKIIAQLDKEAAALNNNIERQKALGESEQELLKQRVEANAEAADKIDERLSQSVDRVVEARAAVRKENTEANREKLKEEEELNKDLLIEAGKIEKEREVLRREGLNSSLKTLDTEKEKAIFEAKKRGQDTLAIEKEFAQKKLQVLKDSYIASKEEIERQEFEIAKIEEEARQERIKKAEDAAQKRRDKLKADLDEITNILKEQSVAFSLQNVAADYERITGILDGLKNKTKDYKGVLKDLEKEGFKPLADVLRNTFGKDAKGNVDEIRKAIDAAFSKDVIDNVTGALEDISAKLQSVTQKNNDILDETVKTFSSAATKPLELISNTIVDSEGKIKESVSSVSLTLQGGFLEISSASEKNIQALKNNAEQQIKAINDLVTKGLLTPEQAKQFFDKINTEYDKGIKAIQEKQVSSTQSLFDTFIAAGQKSIQENLTDLNNALIENETDFINNKVGKGLFKRLKLEEDFQKSKFTITQGGLLAESLAIKNADDQLEKLKKDGLITEEQYQTEKNKIIERNNKVAIQSEKNIANERDRRLQESLKLYQAYFEEVKKYYEVLSTSLQAFGNILADQAALRDLQFEEEIQKVGEVYDARFKLIDEEEKKLDELEQAKETNLTASERKRRALAKERANLEAQQESELAQLENERANAAADAAIKQANLNFALATGQIAISTAEAIIKAVAESPLTFGLPFSAFAAAAGAIQLAAANSARTTAIAQAEASRPGNSGAANVRVSKADGGLITGPGNGVSDSVPANLSNGEFVVNANATQRYLPLLTQLNQSGLQGGNPVNPSGGNNEMVALLQDIKSKLSEPNRAYVVATDIENIQNKQNYINRRSNAL